MARHFSDNTIDLLQETAGSGQLAIALIDESGRQLIAANDNSICRTLNADGKFSAACKPFCGSVGELFADAGSVVSFECHAGLECRAARITFQHKPMIAIAGRAFTKTENYRRTTERAAGGQLGDIEPDRFFDNVLIAGSTGLVDATIERIQARFPVAAEIERTQVTTDEPQTDDIVSDEMISEIRVTQPTVERSSQPHEAGPAEKTNILTQRFDREIREIRPRERSTEQPLEVDELREVETDNKGETADASEGADRVDVLTTGSPDADALSTWRSFFGTILDNDLRTAAAGLIERIATEFNLGSIVWLERNGSTFSKLAARGELAEMRVKIGIGPDDPRMIGALKGESPIEMREKPRGTDSQTNVRSMTMFPIGVGRTVAAAVAVLGPPLDRSVSGKIARVCNSSASHFEILRLRDEVTARTGRIAALRRFSETLRNADGSDPWTVLTQNAAELLESEKASILVFDERQNSLVVRSTIGRVDAPPIGQIAGERVGSLVFERGQPSLVPDIAATNLPPLDHDRGYSTGSFLCCPIIFGERKLGVMNFTDRVGGEPFDRSSYDLYRTVASQIALAADRAILKEKAGEFEQLSVTDSLTGLLNRRYIEARLAEEVKRSNRDNTPMSLLLLDVDHFKSYNDQFGHPAGDTALISVGRIIKDTLRGADVAARYGGEEFAILLPTTSGEEALAIAERIRQNIERTTFPHRSVTVSIGAASCSSKLCVVGDLIDAADKALYRAKERGRNQVVAFEQMAPRGDSSL